MYFDSLVFASVFVLIYGTAIIATHTSKSTYSPIDSNFSMTMVTYSGWNKSHYINRYNADNTRKTTIICFKEQYKKVLK